MKVQDNKFKKNVTIFICSLFTIISSCQKNDQKINPLTQAEKMELKEILKKQLENGASADHGSFDDYTEKDLNVLISIENDILKRSGYIFLSQKQFSDKIKSIFNRIIDPTINSSFLKVDSSAPCDKKIDFKVFTVDFPYIYVSKNNFYITHFLAIPEILNYESKYPELSYIETKDIYITDEIEKTEIKITKWKDVKNLEKRRQTNIQKLINRNKYLFNDNKASLVWLKFNDQQFLESLVKTFGYVQDKDLVKWVLDRNLKNEEFDKLLFTKTCDHKYVFHKEIFEVMEQADTKNKENYIMFLREHFPKIDNKNFTEQTKIDALYCYYATKFSENLDSFSSYSFFPRLKEEQFEQEFKQNNYYNLPDFKELYLEKRNGGIGQAE